MTRSLEISGNDGEMHAFPTLNDFKQQYPGLVGAEGLSAHTEGSRSALANQVAEDSQALRRDEAAGYDLHHDSIRSSPRPGGVAAVVVGDENRRS